MTDPATTPRKVWYAPHMRQAYGAEEEAAVAASLRDGWLAYGPRTEAFEAAIAKRFGQACGLFVNSGSSANLLAVLAAGLGPGDQVVTPACTFSTCLAPFEQARCDVTFCDVVPGRYVPTVEMIMDKVSERTRCIFVPDLLGSALDWAELRRRIDAVNAERAAGRPSGSTIDGAGTSTGTGNGDDNGNNNDDNGNNDDDNGNNHDDADDGIVRPLRDGRILLIEDCADTVRDASHADLVTTSFYASHVITAGGGGGMLMFGDGPLGERLRAVALQYRDWGRVGDNSERVEDRFEHTVDGVPYDYKFLYSVAGYNFKATEMQAAFGLAQLDKLDAFLARRRGHVEHYMRRLAGSGYLLPEDRPDINWLAFPLMHPRRMDLLRHLEGNGVQTRVLMAGNITRHPAYRQHRLTPFQAADRIMAEGFLVGAHHGLEACDIDRVCDLLLEFDKKSE
jgi:dTDP-4-amino-4,6-dideoxygalactose transaminase